MVRMRKSVSLFAILLLAGIWHNAVSQDFALKSNLIADGLLNLNIGAEAGVAPQWTIDITGEFNGWTLSHGRRWKHWYIQPEARYWFCDRFSGHFIGMHAFGGKYNMGGFDGRVNMLGTDFRDLKDARYQGWFVGAGIAYGYAWILSRHWNLEAEIGIGYAYSRYDRFRCAGCGKRTDTDRPHHYFGPTKAAINLVYLF